MSDIQLYLLEVDRNKTEAQHVVEQSAGKLDRKKAKLLDLIASLDPYINSKDDSAVRAKSLAYFADVLEAVGPRTLSLQERSLLCAFLLGRIEADTEGIGHSARALLSLEARGKWDSPTAQKVIQTLVNHANPFKQFKQQAERYACIQLVDRLLAKYRGPLEELHDEDPMFLPGFIMLFDGEKDPRNLMIVFSVMQVIMTEWSVQSSAQDLFDAVFNYFPITFTPPPDDPYGITAQDLKDRLRLCVSATSDLAPHAFPALLDKLDSTSMNTKRDVLQALQDCVVNYEANTINLYSVTLWDALKFEVLAVQEEDLAESALKTLGLMAATLSHAGEGSINAYLRPIIKECNEHLEDAPTKQSAASGRILHGVASGSPMVADKVVRGILPTLFELYRSTESISKRRGLLEVVNQILHAYVDIETAGDAIIPAGLQEHSIAIKEVALRAVTHAPKAEVSFRLTALDSLVNLSRLTDILSSSDISQIVAMVTDLVLYERIPGHGDINSSAIERLAQLAHAQPAIVQSNCIPAFMVDLPDVPAKAESYEAALGAFAQLSRERQIFDTVVLRLKNKYNAARRGGASSQYQLDLLKALLFAFIRGSPAHDGTAIKADYFGQFAESLLNRLRDEQSIDWTTPELDITGRLSLALLKDQSHHFQNAIYNQHRGWMLKSDENISKLASTLIYMYAAFRQEVVEPQDVAQQLNRLATTVLAHQNDMTTSTMLRLITLLIDKFVDPMNMSGVLTETNLDVVKLLQDPSEGSYLLAFAVTKALLLQGKTAALTRTYLDHLLQRVPSMAKPQVRLFATLIAPDELLTKLNHCTISGLYKQKSFAQLVPPIVDAIKTSDTTVKPNYLIAVSGLLRWLPYAVIQSSLHTLVAPLLQGLDLKNETDGDVAMSALSIFESTLMHDPDVVAEHAASLISRLLACTSDAGKSASVRAKALQCLALMPKQLKTEKVVPYRRQVVKQLMKCLDDGKRSVRVEAVKCRANWLALDEVDEDD